MKGNNMKNLSLLIMTGLLILGISGCLGMQISGDEQIIPIAEISARRIGYFVAQNDSINIQTIDKYCTMLIEQDTADLEPMLLYGLRYLSTKYAGDPLIADDLISLIKLLGIDLQAPEINLDSGELRTLRVIIEAFQKGLKVT